MTQDHHTSPQASHPHNIPLQYFGATLRQYRKQRRLSQRILATKTGLSAAYISDIELGQYNVSVLTLLRLAKALDIPSSWLLTRLNPNDPLSPRGIQDVAATSTTSFLTSDDHATLLSLLGATIRQYRQQQQLTQQALAAKTELTASYIGQVERGVRNVTILNLIHIADALELSVDHLLAVLDAYQNSAPTLLE